MTIFFASERPKFRNAQRIRIDADVSVSYGNKTYHGRSIDLAEKGITLLLPEALRFSEEREYLIKVECDGYQSSLYGNIVRVDQWGDVYKYIFSIRNKDESDLQQYLLLLYDRVPEFPKEQNHNKIVKNILNNIKKRRKQFSPFNRKLPRIRIKAEVEVEAGGNIEKIFMEDFNYEYASTTLKGSTETFLWSPYQEKDIKLELKFDESLTNKMNRNLYFYKVMNYKEEMGPVKI